MGDAVFGFQYHAVFEDEATIRLFDDGSDETAHWHPSRVVWLRLDGDSVSLAGSMTIPGNHTYAMGSAQWLPNGNVFVSRGSTPRLSEFSPRGDLLFDAALSVPSCRAFEFAA